MDDTLCDELLQEIFVKLPSSSSSSSSSISLVSKRWLHLYRSSRTSLSLHLPPHFSLIPSSLINFLTLHTSLSSLSLLSSSQSTAPSISPLLLSLISSHSSNLLSLKFLVTPLSLSSITSLSKSCTQLNSLSVTLSRPLFLNWVLSFPCLKDLSIVFCDGGGVGSDYGGYESEDCDAHDVESLGLESLCFEGIRGDDRGVGWLYRRCKKLKKFQLFSCQGIGGSYSSFVHCLKNVEQVELRTCRSVVDGVLLKLLEHSHSLESLLVHDGGSRESLLHFFIQCRSNLLNLDFRLPMDLQNNHLLSIAVNFRGLLSLKLQSCCLVTGDGLKSVGMALSNSLQELALINCDVVEREPGLLATLGQHLRQLRKLDLSYNEMLVDKELVSMLVSCIHLIDLKVRGCKVLTTVALVSMIRCCKKLQNVDIVNCLGIQSETIEMFVKNSCCLRRIEVEENKLSDAAKMWASNKFIQLVV